MQIQAEHIAALFHDAEAKSRLARRAAKDADIAMAELHKALTTALPEMGGKLGIDVQPLSGGVKPPAN